MKDISRTVIEYVKLTENGTVSISFPEFLQYWEMLCEEATDKVLREIIEECNRVC